MTVAVHSSRLQFTRDGGTLVVADPDGVALLGAGGDDQRRVAVAGVHAVAAFADQVCRKRDANGVAADADPILATTAPSHGHDACATVADKARAVEGAASGYLAKLRSQPDTGEFGASEGPENVDDEVESTLLFAKDTSTKALQKKAALERQMLDIASGTAMPGPP